MDYHFIKTLIDKKLLKLTPEKPIIYTSGNSGPVYTDLRPLLSYPEIRNKITDEFIKLIHQKSLFPEIICGVATGAIGWAVLIADRLILPSIYVRKEQKNYGMNKQVEGISPKSKDVIIIEDMIGYGVSSVAACKAVTGQGGNVKACMSIMNCNIKEADKNFKELQIPYYSLTDYREVINIALKNNLLNNNQFNMINDWLNNPYGWYPNRINELGKK
ncbi:MAG TPA: phosphoribosyltransferase family protein [Victivallales bacterium]|nr:phosphoribosyltransferase family protein [Victivallales bacterium]